MNVACDTGSPCSLIPASIFKNLKTNVKCKPCNTSYVDYGGNKIELIGEFNSVIEYRNLCKTIKVVVTNTNNPPLLGRNFLRAFNFGLQQVNSVEISKSNELLLLTEQVKNEFSEIFNGELGAYRLEKISLPIDKNAKPVFFKPRPVPFAWKEAIEKDLQDLIENDVLEPVETSDWGTPLVPILKPNGKLRICGDYKVTVNQFLSDFKYPLPLIDEIFAALQGGELFTKLDMSNAYNQLILDKQSQLLCVWSTHIGTLKMKRLPFGVKPAAAIFQKVMETLLRDIPFVVVYQDDITVSGRNLAEHLKNLKAVLGKLQQAELKLNKSKCSFFQSKISYLGFTINSTGLSKNPERISSILNAPVPKDIHELRAFIGMVNYYSKFINKFADKMSPLYKLLQNNVKFDWSEKCQQTYDSIKREITSDKILVHFNPKLPIVLATDASKNAVAGVLLHQYSDNTTKPIAFISRSLSKTEQNYSTFEKEALAIVFSVTKLRQYLLGNKFILKTDHKALVSIFGQNKGMPLMAAARIQRWAFILSGFNYEISHVKGSLNYADSLSRMPQYHTVESEPEKDYVHLIQTQNRVNIDFKDVARETRRDAILSKVCDFVRRGTLADLKDSEFLPYTQKNIELTVDHGCVLWGYRVIIPQKLRKEILQQLHLSHLGIVKTKALARHIYGGLKSMTKLKI